LQVNGRPGSCLFIKLSFSMSSRGLVFSGVLSHLYNVSVCKLFLLF
jgi:hypothetical protein